MNNSFENQLRNIIDNAVREATNAVQQALLSAIVGAPLPPPVTARKKPGPKPKPTAKKTRKVTKAKKVVTAKPTAKKAPAVVSGTHAERVVAVLGNFISRQATITEICDALPKLKKLSLRKAIQGMANSGQIKRVSRGTYALL